MGMKRSETLRRLRQTMSDTDILDNLVDSLDNDKANDCLEYIARCWNVPTDENGHLIDLDE